MLIIKFVFEIAPVQQVAPKHWVALPKDMAHEAKLEELEEKESD